MAWNKKGSTEGGASTGRDGVKRGGRGGTTGSNVQSVEFADCPTCNGSGQVTFEVVEGDEDGQFSGTQTKKCSKCSGSGRVKKR